MWRLSKSPRVHGMFAAPGNPGIAQHAKCIKTSVSDIQGLLELAKTEAIDLTVVGPEVPLAEGIVDTFRSAGLKIVGPTKYAAQLETSKNFAKEVMAAAGVPTARYETFKNRDEAAAACRNQPVPFVLKADGLAAGKGVIIINDRNEIDDAISFLFSDLAADQVILEEFLEGVEASFIIATDGREIVPLATAHDYKRIGEGNRGPNTGGMGTVSPTPNLRGEDEIWAVENVIAPVLREMERRGEPFTGFLYAGLMLPRDVTKRPEMIRVLEFNARLGDPETQVIMRRLKSDPVDLLEFAAGAARKPSVEWLKQTSVCFVLASKGYPVEAQIGDVIGGIESVAEDKGIEIFHAGVKEEGSKLLTAGGRVLSITACGDDLSGARASAIEACEKVSFEGKQWRRDIGE